MVIIDQTVTWRLAEERLARETDPILRRNLEMLIQHQKAEAIGDMEPLMATVADDAHYHFYDDPSGALDLIGKPAVERFYRDFAASGAQKLQLDTDRLVVDRHCILTEGLMRMAYPGRELQRRGIAVDDPDANYLFEARMAIMWPIAEDGRFLAEDSYTSGDGFAGIEHRKIDSAEIRTYVCDLGRGRNEHMSTDEHAAVPERGFTFLADEVRRGRQFDRDDVERALRNYQDVAAKAAASGDWSDWADLFTDDAIYVEHHFGVMRGHAAIKSWITSVMQGQATDLVFPVLWHVIDNDLVFIYCPNRYEARDGGDPYQFISATILCYAGDGRWCYEEDIYNVVEAGRVAELYAKSTAG